MRSVKIFSSYKRHLSQTETFPKMVRRSRENGTFLAEAKFPSRELQMAVNLISLANASSVHAAINISGTNDSTTMFPRL